MASLFAYAAAHAALTAAPGPVTAIVLTRTLTSDFVGAAGFSVGVCVGKIVAILAIVSGLGLWADHGPEWLRMFRLAGAAYMLFLAVRMWREPPQESATDARGQGWFGATMAGTVFSAGSPYTFLFYLAFLPSVAPLGFGSPPTLALVLLVTVAIVGGVMAGVIVMTRQFRRLVIWPSASVLFRRLMALLLGATSFVLLAA